MQFKGLLLTMTFLLNLSLASFAQDPLLLEHGGSVRTVEFSPVDASLVASAGESHIIKLWNLRNNTMRTLNGHTSRVNSVAFSRDGELLVSVSDDRTIKLWNVHNHQNIRTLQDGIPYRSVAFSRDGELLATGGDKHVKLWDARRWTAIATLQHDQWVRSVTFSYDGQLLAAGDFSEEGPSTVTVWDVERRQVVVSLDANPKEVKAVEFSSDNRYLAGSGWDGGYLKVWDVSNWELLGKIPNTGHYDIAFSPDGKTLVSTNGGVVFWSVETGENITSFPAPEGWRHPLDFSPDGTTLAVSGDDGLVRIYNNVDAFQETPQQPEMVRIIYFLPNDRRPQPDINVKLDALIKDAQRFYADEMERHGFGRKTFQVETDRNGKVLVHHVRGKYNDIYYQKETAHRVNEETKERFAQSKALYLFAVDVSTEGLGLEDAGELACGQGGDRGAGGGFATLPASGHCFNIQLTAHEFGHAFGLHHDFRDDAYIMSYGGRNRNQISKCAAEWLDVHPYFNLSQSQTSFYKMTKIQMHSPLAAPPNAIRLRFQIDDTDGLHQIQMLTPATAKNQAPGSPKLLDYRPLDSKSSTVEFIATELTAGGSNEVILRVIDAYGNFVSETYPIRESATVREHTNRVRVIDVPGRVPETLQKISGDNQREILNKRLSNPFIVAVRGADNEPVAGVQATFRVTAGGGRLSVKKPWTDSNGRAETFLTLGGSLINSVEASVSGVSDRVTFSTYSEPQVLIVQSQHPPMYWIDASGTLHRLIGDEVENLLPNVQNATGLAVDAASNKIYWTEQTGKNRGRIRGANLDGSNVQILATSLSVPTSIALDPAQGKLYWTNTSGRLKRVNVNGEQNQALIKNLKDPNNITLDIAGGKLYWTEASGHIRRANMDGSNIEDVVITSGVPLSLIFVEGTVYWTEKTGENHGEIRFISRHDGNVVTRITLGDSFPIGLAFDPVEDRMYWTTSSGTIGRSSLSIRNFQPDFVTGLGTPGPIDIKISNANLTAAPLKGSPASAEAPLPDATLLLANYPNPFNPETWIPYQLAEASDVKITIYDGRGVVILHLELGHQSAGTYIGRNRAAYWDGKNEIGEAVASGVYFYTLSADDFTSTRKMFIRK